MSATGKQVAGHMTGEAVSERGESATPRRSAQTVLSRKQHGWTGLHQWAGRAIAAEPWLAVLSAAILLLAPNPFVVPAALAGLLPLASRIYLTGRPWRPTVFDLPVGLLIVGALVGAFVSLSPDAAMIRLAGLLAALVLFVALREHVRTVRAVRVLVLGALVATLLGLAALLVLVGPFLRLDHLPPLASLVATVDRWQIGNWFVDQDWLLQRYRFRASGVGALADVGLALTFAALIGTRGIGARVALILSAAFCVIVLIVADNRGSVLAAALTLGVMATAWKRRLLPLVPLAALAAVALVALSPADRGLSLNTLAQRVGFWENSLYLGRELPLTGAGLGLESVQLVYRAYFQPTYPPFSHAHDIYLQGLLEYGIFGLLGLVGFGIGSLWLAWRSPLPADRWTLAGRLAGLGVALAMLTTGLTEIALLTTLGGVIGLAGLGLLSATAEGPTPAPSPLRWRGEQMPRSPLSIEEGEGVGGWGLPRARWRPSRVRLVVAAIVAVVAIGLVVSGLGPVVAGRVLLNVGTAELNRGSLSEALSREQRAADLERAVSLLRQASTISPNDPAIQRNLALALAATDDSRRGRAAADRAKALTSPDNRSDLFQLGRAYTALSAWGETIRAWQAAGAGGQLLQLGNRLIRARNFDQAENAFAAAARLDPDSRGAYDGITQVGRQREMTAKEIEGEFAPLLEPGSATEYDALLAVSRAYREDGQPREAREVLKRAQYLQAGGDLSVELGLVAMQAGLADVAVDHLERAAGRLPYDPDTWFSYSRALARAGRYEDAVAAVRSGLSRLDPSGQFAPPAPRLPETAAVRAEQIKRSERAPLLGVLGQSLIALGRPGEALPALDEAVDAKPGDPWLASILTAAHDGLNGAPPDLLGGIQMVNGDGWVLRPANGVPRPTMETLDDNLPAIVDGMARWTPNPPGSLALVREASNLEPGARYRLTARVRGEGLRRGRLVMSLVTGTVPAELLGAAMSAANEWTTLDVEATVPPSTAQRVYVVVSFTDDATPGAVAWCDDVTLVRTDIAR